MSATTQLQEHPPHGTATPTYLSLAEASTQGYGYSTLRKKIAEGVLPAVKRGRQYFVREDDLHGILQRPVGRPSEDASISAAIDRIVSAAPHLSRDQRLRIATALGGDV